MTALGADAIEWRPSPGWALKWLALHVFVLLPFLIWGAWLAAQNIANAPEGTWPAYLFFLGAFATLVLGTLIMAVLAGVATHALLLFDRRPVVQTDRHALRVRMPMKPLRVVRWQDISAIKLERTRRAGGTLYVLNHVLVLLRDKTAPELTIKPRIAGISLADGDAALNALLTPLPLAAETRAASVRGGVAIGSRLF